ncbi:hypothetical protein ED733_002739 [Metarhizium rileyi]|uniref:Cellobiose dehydrogenase-like cytochrome domain-containing protein n=1 Tax=Metarhizium rileyi (strain RCEF 4871) TaxID=1649241 RepID=A0A5C6G306_METRR|nr:hypothetical protein ED733_002739 [Metarhizium rileyi]
MWSSPHVFTHTVLYAAAALLSQGHCQKKVTAAFTDAATNISFQRFFGAKTSFAFGIALPEAPNNSFIGQLSFPLSDGAGWGGWSLTDDMKGPLLMAALGRRHESLTDNFKARPIATGTSVNSSSLTYTFLCEECLDEALELVATAATGTAKMGWALGSNKVENSASPAAMLNFHHLGFGGFQAQLAEARSAQFDQWATMAGAPLAPAAGASLIESEKKKKKEKGKDEIKGGVG